MYPAKIIQIKADKRYNFKYLIHYIGWKKSYDEWVTGEKLFKNPDKTNLRDVDLKKRKNSSRSLNFTRSKRVASKGGRNEQSTKISKKKPPRSSSRRSSQKTKPKPNDSVKANLNSKQKRTVVNPCAISSKHKSSTNMVEMQPVVVSKDLAIKEEISLMPADLIGMTIQLDAIDIVFPLGLVYAYIQHWKFVTEQNKLLPLPCKSKSVYEVIQDFIEYMGQNERQNIGAIQVARGILHHFDDCFGLDYLYEPEREQHLKFLQIDSKVELSKVYGPIHLLQLLSKIGNSWELENFDQDDIQLLQKNIRELLTYMIKNQPNLFPTTDYVQIEQH